MQFIDKNIVQIVDFEMLKFLVPLITEHVIFNNPILERINDNPAT